MTKISVQLILSIFLVFTTINVTFFSQTNVDEISLIRAYKKENNSTNKFWKLYELGVYYQANNVKKADSLRSYILQAGTYESDSARFFALSFDADLVLMNGDKEEYFNKVLSMQSFLSQTTSKEIKWDIYQRLGDYHLHYREFEQANIYLNQALKISKKIRDNRKISETYRLRSIAQMQANLKDSALLYVEESIQFGRRSADKKVLAKAFNTKALIYFYFGQIELSVSKNLVALQLANEIGDLSKISKYSLDLGDAQFMIQNYREAELYFKQASDMATRINDNRLIAFAQINLGVIYKIKKDFINAIESQKKAIKMLYDYNDYDGLGTAHNNLGDIYRENGDYSNALSNYNKALVYFESSRNREKIATVYHNVGVVFEKQGKHDNALNYLNRSVEISSQFGFKGSVFNTYKTISDVYKRLGNYNLAYKYLKIYTDYSDSSKTIESSAKIAELSELYRSEQREKYIVMQADSIERQRQEKALATTQLENIKLKTNLQTYVIIGFILILALGGIIGFYRWNQTQIKQQQKEAEMNQTLLRAQMNPHFVFNAMSVIQSYIYDNDTKNSSKFLVNFSKLMRLILENSSKELISIETEVSILDKYLGVQKLRFEERFNFSINVDETLYNEGAMIPPMITQPFIENAIEHGRLHLIENGFINVYFFKEKEMLHITVEDNGVGRKESSQNKKSKDHKSMAMKITSERIQNLNKKYRSAGYLQIEDYDKEKGTGTKILISIPYRVNNQNLIR
jgi:tetratricopeptide (TPR) repeat protein